MKHGACNTSPGIAGLVADDGERDDQRSGRRRLAPSSARQTAPLDVLFDHHAVTTQRHGGVSRYVVELVRAMQGMAGLRARLLAPAHLNEHIRPGDPLHPMSFGMAWPGRGIRYRPSALMPVLKLALRAGKPHVLHETAHDSTSVPLPRGARRVTTVHDMTVERFAHLFDAPQRRMADKLTALRRADAIICISEHTRRDLLEIHPEFADRCAVVHHGVNHVAASGPRPNVLPVSYLLYVGTRRTYKNFDHLIRALGASTRLPRILKLLCFGGGPLTEEELRLCDHAGWSRQRIVQVDGDDSLLAQAYRHAELFVFPSLYEGFGMPLTEAMVQGCPIACSRTAVFTEVCAESAAYFDAADPADLAACVESVVLDPVRRDSLAQASLAHAQRYSWDRCAAETAEVYRRALSSENNA